MADLLNHRSHVVQYSGQAGIQRSVMLDLLREGLAVGVQILQHIDHHQVNVGEIALEVLLELSEVCFQTMDALHQLGRFDFLSIFMQVLKQIAAQILQPLEMPVQPLDCFFFYVFGVHRSVDVVEVAQAAQSKPPIVLTDAFQSKDLQVIRMQVVAS